MPHIDISSPNNGSAMGTTLRVDGREIEAITSIQLLLSVDEPVTASVSVLASDGLHFEGHADLILTVCVLPGFVLIEETRADGVKTYRTESEAK